MELVRKCDSSKKPFCHRTAHWRPPCPGRWRFSKCADVPGALPLVSFCKSSDKSRERCLRNFVLEIPGPKIRRCRPRTSRRDASRFASLSAPLSSRPPTPLTPMLPRFRLAATQDAALVSGSFSPRLRGLFPSLPAAPRPARGRHRLSVRRRGSTRLLTERQLRPSSSSSEPASLVEAPGACLVQHAPKQPRPCLEGLLLC